MFMMSGKRKRDDSEAIVIMKFFKSTKILLFISSLNYLQENLKQMLSLETICILTSVNYQSVFQLTKY